ncbi:MAG: nicotinate (nicotinamide) nucleotide adenylyltransferase [Fibrobacter sp.]|nr:nicotinate (nicotinamide) nucleotide adenylyltransferase [Fibrobacter sp.]
MSGHIGILGGIFDPVHNGHLAIASLAREFFGLQKVLFIPSGSPPHKDSVTASAEDRLAMLRLALKNEPGAEIREEELHRSGYSYTIDTLHELRKQYDGQFFFIIGSDNITEIPGWHRYRRIIQMVELCIAHRPGYAIKIPPELKEASVRTFPSPEWGISSTMIRRYLKEGLSCRHLIPEQVREYILKKGLYRNTRVDSMGNRKVYSHEPGKGCRG